MVDIPLVKDIPYIALTTATLYQTHRPTFTGINPLSRAQSPDLGAGSRKPTDLLLSGIPRMHSATAAKAILGILLPQLFLPLNVPDVQFPLPHPLSSNPGQRRPLFGVCALLLAPRRALFLFCS